MATRRGHFIVLVGPDGTGKTTLARQLIADHGPPSMYMHFRPTLRQRPSNDPIEAGVPPPKRATPGPRLLGWLRLANSVVLFWLGYLRWVKRAVGHGALVVGDRWAYGYVGQPVALGFAGPAWLARLAVRIVPRPDLLVRLRAAPELIALRKTDLTPAAILREDQAWGTLPVPAWELDATLDAALLAKMIAARLLDKT